MYSSMTYTNDNLINTFFYLDGRLVSRTSFCRTCGTLQVSEKRDEALDHCTYSCAFAQIRKKRAARLQRQQNPSRLKRLVRDAAASKRPNS